MTALLFPGNVVKSFSLTSRGPIFQGLRACRTFVLLLSALLHLCVPLHLLVCLHMHAFLSLCVLFSRFYQTVIGQTLDLIRAHQGNVDFGRFTEKKYKSIVKYKTAFYSFYLPVAAAIYMAGIDEEKEHAIAEMILPEIREFFRDPSVTGKIGTDVQDNKCSWLVVQCLIMGKRRLRRSRVKLLYKELNLPAVFMQYEEGSYSPLMSLVEQYAMPLPQQSSWG
ncbi:unnamed protein product [Nyctereutes procyonoides]|uniref:(2E,6E)-farnesyl diphosphate synthase n=1 Tax=Nyctereutes procyonoides TaxID=34880 RepID=A0A811ZWY7_NYCPR|nr:unnamed protein product [Nyctereutes procyonoides]